MVILYKKHFPYKRLIKKIFEKALQTTRNCVDDVAVGLCLVDKKMIRHLNQTYRNIDKETDVLSFPFLNIDYKTDKLEKFDAERNPDGQLFLGDIYICKEVAKKQAKEYGHSNKREICFLALHGLLHLLGYDHIKKTDERVMMQTAEEILQNCNVGRKHD